MIHYSTRRYEGRSSAQAPYLWRFCTKCCAGARESKWGFSCYGKWFHHVTNMGGYHGNFTLCAIPNLTCVHVRSVRNVRTVWNVANGSATIQLKVTAKHYLSITLGLKLYHLSLMSHCHWCQGQSFPSCSLTYAYTSLRELRTWANGAFARGYLKPPQSDMSTLSWLSSEGAVAELLLD